jgi:DNA-directed RNA polymerase subunit M/transcription elongation factor TFIIS
MAKKTTKTVLQRFAQGETVCPNCGHHINPISVQQPTELENSPWLFFECDDCGCEVNVLIEVKGVTFTRG